MSANFVTIKLPNLAIRGAKAAFRRAMLWTFERHRKRSLAAHFMADAPDKYGGAYKTRTNQVLGTFRARWLAMTPDQRRKFFERQREERRKGSALKSLGSSDSSLPMVETGRLRQVITRTGPLKVVVGRNGTYARISGAPYYLTMQPAGGIRKHEALLLVTPGENAAFTRDFDTALQRELR